MDHGAQLLAVNFRSTNAATPAVDVNVNNSIGLQNNSQILSQVGAGPPGTGRSGDISLTAGNRIDVNSSSAIISESRNLGRSGDIILNGNTIEVSSNAGVVTQTFSTGSAGNLSVHGDETVTVTGVNSRIISEAGSRSGNSGSTTITGGDLTVSNLGTVGTASRTSGSAGATTIDVVNVNILEGGTLLIEGGSGNTGLLSVTAQDTVLVSGLGPGNEQSLISNRRLGGGSTGEVGGVEITSTDFLLDGGARVSSETANATSGALTISATNGNLTISGNSEVVSRANNVDVGEVSLDAQNITIDQAVVRSITGGNGMGGALTFTGQNVSFQDGALIRANTVGGSGQGGSVNIVSTGPISLSGGAQIQSNSEIAATGASGNISLTADGTVSLSGVNSGLFSETATSGNGGNITVQGSQVSLENGSTVSAQSSGVVANAGVSGNVTITATGGNFQSDNATISTSAAQSTGGNINITAGQNAEFTNGALVEAVNTNGDAAAVEANPAVGQAGGILVTAGNTILVGDSTISVQSAQGNAGDIKFDAGFMIHVIDSVVSGSTGGGPSTSGANINFDPQWIILENSQILANAFEGTGGNVTLIADNGVFIDSSTVIDFSSTFGTSGSLDVQAPIQNLSGVITPLPDETLKVSKMYAERCAAQKGGQFSSFVQGARDGLPPAPGGFMPSPLQFSAPQAQSRWPSSNNRPSTPMVKRLGLEQGGGFGEHEPSAYWVIGNAIQGCAA